MLIAIDADGVVCDLHGGWLPRYNRDYDDNLTIADIVTWDMHTLVKPACGRKIYDYLSQPDLYDDVPVMAGAEAGVAAIRALGHDIVFATSCTYGMVDQKARWFEQMGFCAPNPDGRGLPKEFVPIGAKHWLDAHLLIDDGPHNVRAWVEQKRRKAVLLEAPWSRSLLDEVPSTFWSWCHRAKDWPAIIKYIEGLGA